MKLDKHDLAWALTRLPKHLKKIIEDPQWRNIVFVGGGYLRAIVAGETVNDVDVFVPSKTQAELLAHKLTDDKKNIVETDNAYTVKGKLPIQIIHRWLFSKPEDVANSFDFTICCAVIFFNGTWDSFCDDRFYIDIASKRLVYRSPVRNEDAGGSMLRVLKYYQKGYRIPLDSLGYVMARMVAKLDTSKIDIKNENDVGFVLTGLLREVDPAIDPFHNAHLPSLTTEQ